MSRVHKLSVVKKEKWFFSEGGQAKAPHSGVDNKNLNVPAQENSTACNKSRLALASRARREEE